MAQGDLAAAAYTRKDRKPIIPQAQVAQPAAAPQETEAAKTETTEASES